MSAPLAKAIGRRSPGGRRWLIGGLLGIGAFVNYIDRVNISIAATPLANELHVSPTQMGFVFSAFLWTYAALQIPIGTTIDRIGVRWAMRLATVLWTISTLLTAFASGLGGLLMARLLLGVAEAPLVPASWKATGQWFPDNERGKCTALFDCASRLSMVVGIPLMALAVSHYGWQAAFYVTALVSALYTGLFWRTYREPVQMLSDGWLGEAEHRYILDGGAQVEASDHKKKKGYGDVLHLLGQRKTWGLAFGFASYTYLYYVLLTWLPAFLMKQFTLNIVSSGIYTGIPWVVAVIAEFLVAGCLVDRLIEKGADPTRVRRVTLVAGMTLSLGVIGAAYAPTLTYAVTFLTIGAVGLAITGTTVASVVALIAPEGCIAALGGIVNCVANVCGLVAPIVTGIVFQRTGSFTAAFLICGVVVAAGMLSFIVVLGPIKRIPGY